MVADMSWDEVERVLTKEIATTNSASKQLRQSADEPIGAWMKDVPGAVVRETRNRATCAKAAKQQEMVSAALTYALRCVRVVRWMEERRVFPYVEKDGNGQPWTVLMRWNSGLPLDQWKHIARTTVAHEPGWPTPLEALEAAMAAVKGESGGCPD